MIEAIPSNGAASMMRHGGSRSPFFVAQEPRPEHSLLRHKKQQQPQQQQLLQQTQHHQDHYQDRQSSSSPSSSPLLPVSPWKSPTVQKKLAASRTLSNHNHNQQQQQQQSSSSSSSHVFSERLALMSKFFDLCNPCEQVVTMCALAKKMKKRQVKFLTRILEQLMTSDPTNDDEIDEEDDDDGKLEKEANDPGYLRNLARQSRNEMISNLLLRFPLLEPGNNPAKQEYLKLIPKAVDFTSSDISATDNNIDDHSSNNNNDNNNNSNNESLSSKSWQLLTYMCIHPALKRNEFSGFALLLNHGSDLFQSGRTSPCDTASPDFLQDRHHQHHQQQNELEKVDGSQQWKSSAGTDDVTSRIRSGTNVAGRISTGSDSGNTSDDIGDIGDVTRLKEGQAKMADCDELDPRNVASIGEVEKNRTWNHDHHHHQQQQQQQINNSNSNSSSNNGNIAAGDTQREARDSCRLSVLSCSSRDSGISVQFDTLTKRGLAPSLSMPTSREMPDEEPGQGSEMTFAEKVKIGINTGAGRFGPSNPQGIWNNFGDFGNKGGAAFPYLDEKDDTKRQKAISPAPKVEGHARLARTVSLVPDWLNKVQTAEEITNPAFRMRLILGPNSSHLPLSPQSSTTSTDSNESQADARIVQDGKDSDWSMILSGWLKSLRLHKYTNLLQKLNYDELLSLSEDWLVQRDVTKGARDKLLLNVKKLQERPNQLDVMEESLKSSPDSLQTTIIELTHLLKTPMKRVPDQGWFCHSPRLADRENLPSRIVNLIGKIRTELLVSKQHHVDSGLCSSFLRLMQACSGHPCFGDDQRKKLISWTNHVNKLHNSVLRPSFDRSRNYSYRNSSGHLSGIYRPGVGSHQPLARRSTAMPYGSVGNSDNNKVDGGNNNNNAAVDGSNNNGQQSSGTYSNFQGHLLTGLDFKPKPAISRTHSAPLDGNVSPGILPLKNCQMTNKLSINTTMEDTCSSPLDLDPSMQKHALGGMLQDLS